MKQSAPSFSKKTWLFEPVNKESQTPNEHRTRTSRRYLGSCAALILPLTTGSLFAQTAPVINRQPSSLARSLGDAATLSVLAGGDAPLQYQWFRDGLPLNGATNRALSFTNLTATMAGTYTVSVSNAVSTVTSSPAVLDVNTLFRLVSESPISHDNSFGMAWGDYKNDGFPDLLATTSSNSLLYQNNGNGSWTKNPPNARTLTGRSFSSDNVWTGYWADYDNDGILDMLVPTGGNLAEERDQLFHGEAAGAFRSVTDGPLVTDSFATMDGVWGDFDGDGRLDLFVSRVPQGATGTGVSQPLYWGELNGSFTRTLSGDFANDPERFGYGATAGDFNGDGRRDIAFALGRGVIMLYENQGNRQFKATMLPGGGTVIASPAAADYDNDGDLDLFVTYAKGFCQLLRNDGTGQFEVVFDVAPVEEPGRSASAAWGDYDNDGWLDLFVSRTASASNDGDNSDSLFHNNGDGTFSRVDAGSLTNDHTDGFGCAWADYDNDGFLDLARSGSPSQLFHNSGNANHWLQLNLVGTTSNRSALGARIRLTAKVNGKTITQLREIGTGAGWSQNDLRAHFGLGDAAQADEIAIEWPSGRKQSLAGVVAGQILTVVEPGAAPQLKITRDSALHLQLEGDPNTTYALEATAELGSSWTVFATPTLTTDGAGKASLTVGPSAENPAIMGTQFFRARTP